MKFVLSLTILGFIVLGCKKKTEVSTPPMSDSTIAADSITAPVPPDTIQTVDSTSAKSTDTLDTTNTTK